jgi:hypothetical protein
MRQARFSGFSDMDEKKVMSTLGMHSEYDLIRKENVEL